MTGHGDPGLDLRSLADDVVEGRRSLDNVIDQIAVATPDDRARRRAVAGLQARIVARTGAEAREAADAAPGTGAGASPGGAGRMGRQSRVTGLLRGLAARPALSAGLVLALAAVAAAVAVASLRP